jgi:hypothetical protein
MASTRFNSLLQFKEQLAFQASILDRSVTEDLLSRLDPAAVFRDAIQGEKATSDDLRLFLTEIKSAKAGPHPLLSDDGLASLLTALWQVCYQVRWKLCAQALVNPAVNVVVGSSALLCAALLLWLVT